LHLDSHDTTPKILSTMRRAMIGLLTLIMSAAALRFAQEVPDQSLDLEIESIKTKLVTEPDQCDEHTMNLLAHFETFLSTAQKSQIQKAFSNIHTDLQFLAIGTKHTTCMTDNWFVHALKATTQPAEFVYVSLDEESQLSCVRDFQPRGGEKHTVKCVDLSDYLPWSQLQNSKTKMGFGSCLFQLILYAKVLILKVAATSLADPSSLLMMDTDIIVHRDVRELLSSGKTYMFQMQDEGYHLPNTGFVNINRNATDLIDGWMQQAAKVYPNRKADQAAIAAFLSSEAGQPFKQEMHLFRKSDVMKCGKPGKYATHYNCYLR
jgi:hypothetical protein